MTTMIQGDQVRAITTGILTRRAAALPPASGATADLFSVDGGQVLLVGFVGYVTVAIPNESIDFDIYHDPDDGGSNVAMASLLAVDNLASGSFFTLNATAGGALVTKLDIAYQAKLSVPILLDPGDIVLNVAGGGAIGTAARVRWDAIWVPWDTGAALTAV